MKAQSTDVHKFVWSRKKKKKKNDREKPAMKNFKKNQLHTEMYRDENTKTVRQQQQQQVEKKDNEQQ